MRRADRAASHWIIVSWSLNLELLDMRFGQVFLAKYCLLALLGCLASTASVRADEEDRLYDFTDEFYLFNGVNPEAIEGRREADGLLAVPDEPVGPHHRPVRSLLTLPAYNHSGDVEF